ncbi:hypothetical protein [Planococcus sp. S3-L1]|uniref:hypothetical protein n=1 Tax=Planococcus TaxID=1372 RepID=UPI0024B8C36C|nr:hypothetical protein [Planococcus sp. S3-L1]MDJ0333277.1 hypothetical protein [Planococcus sp. S3-L1]
MSTPKKEMKSIHLKVSEELLSEIDNFTQEYHFTNRTDAMRFLMVSGMKWQTRVDEIMNEIKEK